MRIRDWSSACALPILVVRMEPGDRKMTTCADDQLIGLFGIGGSPDDHRFAIGSFLPDRFNQGGAAVIAKRRIVARIAWPDRAFRRLQANGEALDGARSEEHTSDLQSLMRISYAVFCLKKKKTTNMRT